MTIRISVPGLCLLLLACETPLQPAEPRPAARATGAEAYKESVDRYLGQGQQADLSEALVGTWWEVIGVWRKWDGELTPINRSRWTFHPISEGSGVYIEQSYVWPPPEESALTARYTSSGYTYSAYQAPPSSADGWEERWETSGYWRVEDKAIVLSSRSEDGTPEITIMEHNIVIAGVWLSEDTWTSRYPTRTNVDRVYYEPEQ